MVSEEKREVLRDQHYCEDHDFIKVKNALGKFSCPFCDADFTPRS